MNLLPSKQFYIYNSQMHTRILAAPGQIDFSVIPESLDLCPGCNWDEAWLSRPWMWLNAPFILLLFWGFFFTLFIMLFWAFTTHCQLVQFPFLYLTSLLPLLHPTNKPSFGWMFGSHNHICFFTPAHSRLSCSFFLPPSRLNFYHLSVLTWKNCSEGRWWKQKGLMGNWQTQG